MLTIKLVGLMLYLIGMTHVNMSDEEATCPRHTRMLILLKYIMEYKEISYDSINVEVAITQQLHCFLDVHPDDVDVTTERLKKLE